MPLCDKYDNAYESAVSTNLFRGLVSEFGLHSISKICWIEMLQRYSTETRSDPLTSESVKQLSPGSIHCDIDNPIERPETAVTER